MLAQHREELLAVRSRRDETHAVLQPESFALGAQGVFLFTATHDVELEPRAAGSRLRHGLDHFVDTFVRHEPAEIQHTQRALGVA
ncbi:MAG: hypothetical protein RL701_7826 [Pseudomonadota bacterium]